MRSVAKYKIAFLYLFIPLTSVMADTTDVHVIVARLEYTSFEIKGYYEFIQVYQPIAIDDTNYTEIGNIYYYQAPAIDFGFTSVLNSLTGDTAFHASSVWAGMGRMVFPHDSLFITEYDTSDLNSPPDTLNSVLLFEGTAEMADSAWSQVKNTDFIHRLDSLDHYDVFIFDHFYSLGVADSTTAEWIIVAFTKPFVTEIKDLPHRLPANYTLSQNYPNPFNPESVIEYSLPQSGDVSLIVYNLLGREVTRLINGRQNAGSHSVLWDASNFPSDIYFYRLQAGDFVQTRKMLLLK